MGPIAYVVEKENVNLFDAFYYIGSMYYVSGVRV